MCHCFLNDARFYRLLFEIDRDIAVEVKSRGCPHCGGVLHLACYVRKPRGIRCVLGETYQSRLSFCCSSDCCRRRTTPPSVRFLGRKVYLGVIVILVCALGHGLSGKRRKQLIEQLDIWPQTIARWRRWWREAFAASQTWQTLRGRLCDALDSFELPDSLLGRLRGADLRQRLVFLLRLIAPVTTTSCAVSMLFGPDPQKM